MFKVGDKVVRTKGCHAGMHKGDFGTVVKVELDGGIVLKEFPPEYTHDEGNFKLSSVKFTSVHKPHVSIAGTSMGGGSWTHRLIKVRNKLDGRKAILVEVREGAYKKQVLRAVKAAICDIEKLSGKKLKVKFV